MKLAGFDPVGDEHTHTLILGSFPGVASLAATQYYAHPRNQFWKLAGAAIGENLHDLAYPDRLESRELHRASPRVTRFACELR